MTETVKYTRFDGSSLLVADAIYDVGDSVDFIDNPPSAPISTTISNIINDVNQDDRVVTEKDKPWFYNSSNGYLYTHKKIRAVDDMITTESRNSSFFKCDSFFVSPSSF